MTKSKNPRADANFFSRFSFWWIHELFAVGWKRQVTEDDLYEVLEEHKSDKIHERFKQLWAEELNRKNPSFMRVLYKSYCTGIMIWGFLYSVFEVLSRIAQPLLLGGFVSYFTPGQNVIAKDEAYLYAAGIILCFIFPLLTFHKYMLYTYEIAMKLKIGASCLIYQKSLELSKSTMASEGLSGMIINLLANDVVKFDYAVNFLHDLWKGPVSTILYGYFIFREIGVAGLIGIAFLLCIIPIQAYIGKLVSNFRRRAAIRTDERVRFMNEIIQGIQVIKMYTWENSFAKMVQDVRKKEINAFKGTAYIQAILISFLAVSRLSIFISLISYALFGNIITAKKVFIVTSFYKTINETLLQLWPVAVVSISEGYISVKRIQEFLMIPSDKNKIQTKPGNIGVILVNAKASWKVDQNRTNKGIEHLNFCFEKEGLCAIIGQVGSGKSTLFQVILGELQLSEGSINVNGQISYSAQEPWLFEGSVKENIVFIEDFDQKRYEKVVKICALERDFQLFLHGDETIVGERGVSLSGGQKARINLARAIYKKADIYLLDDPLSAVDAEVGKHIFEHCISEFLKDKICILITHQIQYLTNLKHVVLMENAAILMQGSYEKVKNSKSLSNYGVKEETEKPETFSISDNIQKIKQEKKQEEVKENLEAGSVQWKVYQSYLKAVKSYFWVMIVVLFMIIAQTAASGVDYFVAQWVNWEESLITTYFRRTVNEIRNRYILFYGILIAILVYTTLQKTFSFFYVCLRISKNLHDQMFRGIIRATMYFFNTNSSGRILNRFSRDISTIDVTLPTVLQHSFAFILEMTSIVILVAIVNPWYLIPTIIISILMYFLRKMFINSARMVKRIESLSRSPIFAWVNATLQGLTTIRALKAQEKQLKKFYQLLDVNSNYWFLFIASSRAFAMWLDFLCVIYITVVILSFLIVNESYLGGNVGLAVTQVIGLVTMCQWGMRQTAELENQMVSVERIIEYVNIESEANLETDDLYRPKDDWPEFGGLKFENLRLRYSKNGDLILNNLNFEVKPKEKIGIVGRTGAGKSSIVQALFRLAETEGIIEIDGSNTQLLGLKDLRSRISIIPQDPILFSGPLRDNLDPFKDTGDDELWMALDEVELKETVSRFSDGLEYLISDGGANFSLGQRQLICLARAILRKNKILVLDEATANVDLETDKLIQSTIRTKFKECTVLTIAHRLNTVMDSDKILVMDAGKIVEYDEPKILLSNPKGVFHALLEQSGKVINSQ